MPSSLPCTITLYCLGFVALETNDVGKKKQRKRIKIENPETEKNKNTISLVCE